MTAGCAVSLHRFSSIVHLEVDNRQCFQQFNECFQSTKNAAAFLGAMASSGKLDFPYTIEAIFSEYTLQKSKRIIEKVFTFLPNRFLDVFSLLSQLSTVFY